MSELESVTFSFMGIVLCILAIILYLRCKYSNIEKYKFSNKIKRINWLILLKYWAIIQFFCLFGDLTISGKIIFPVFILIFLILHAFSNPDPEKNHIENTIVKNSPDFQQWQKSEERNKKINQILK